MESIWILAWLSELSTANLNYVHLCPQPPTLLNCVCIPPFFLINKHYHRLTDYQLVLAVSCSLIPGPPVHYRSFTMSITAKTASLRYKTTITALFTTALATNNHAKWQKGGKQMIKQFEFLSSHLCLWQMLLSKASYTAFKVYILSSTWEWNPRFCNC